MEKISARLQTKIDAAPPGTMFRLIVTLFQEADWGQGLVQLKAAGFQVESAEEAVRAVFGKTTGDSVSRIAGLSAVALVELDARAEALD